MNDITYSRLFYISFYTSAISFGGGYLVLPLLENEYTIKRNYLSQERVLEIAAIAQSSPGAIAINLAAGLAYEIKGLKGLLVAALASTLPPFIIISIIAKLSSSSINNFYLQTLFQGLDLSVIAIMLGLNLSMTQTIYKKSGLLLISISLFFVILVYLFEIHLAVVLALYYVLVSIINYWRKSI